MTYHIIALDLDGTLLDRQKKILPESLITLALARQQGAKVIIVTGRHHSAIHPFYQALNLDTPAICCNGTYLYDYQKKQTSKANPLTAAQAKSVLTLLGEYGIHGLIYADDGMLYQEQTGHVIRTQAWGETLPLHQRPTFLHADNLFNAADQVKNIWKFALSHTDTQALNNFAQQVMDEFSLTCEWSCQDQIDVVQSGNNKGKLLREWVTSQGYAMNEVLAFGDNFNDISMLKYSGLGIAMGNSDDAVKKHADLVIGQNEEPSIAQFIRQRVLQ
ncbi:MAG: pyridoxal phosphatase [Candidatus Malihini olakiniferum]